MASKLPYSLLDADYHLYETQASPTRYLRQQHEDDVRYAGVKGRTKVAIRGQVSNYIANPVVGGKLPRLVTV